MRAALTCALATPHCALLTAHVEHAEIFTLEATSVPSTLEHYFLNVMIFLNFALDFSSNLQLI